MLRPIDVIFKHPVKKFTVIYQNGKLWQLPRLEFDGNSLRHKRPYMGSREQIFVAQDQGLPADDWLLRSQLATLPLPDTVAGKNADEFERWWQQNSYACRALSERAKHDQAHAKALLASPNTQSPQALQVGIAPQVENQFLSQHLDTPDVTTDIQPTHDQPIQMTPPLPAVSKLPPNNVTHLPTVVTETENCYKVDEQNCTNSTVSESNAVANSDFEDYTSQPQSVSPIPTVSSPDLADFDNIFDDMMADLTKELK